MPNILLSLLLALQLMLPGTVSHPPAPTIPVQEPPQVSRLWWGMIDPELSTWFSRIPMEEQDSDRPILWNWSWRGFLAALFHQPMLKEASDDASTV